MPIFQKSNKNPFAVFGAVLEKYSIFGQLCQGEEQIRDLLVRLFFRPACHSHLRDGVESGDVGFDVNDRRPIECINVIHTDPPAFNR